MPDWKQQLADLLADSIGDFAKALWRKLTGDNKDPPVEIVERFVERTIDTVAEIKAQAELLGLQIELVNLVDATRGVLDAFTPKGVFPSIVEPGNIEIVETLDDVIAEPAPDDGKK